VTEGSRIGRISRKEVIREGSEEVSSERREQGWFVGRNEVARERKKEVGRDGSEDVCRDGREEVSTEGR